MKNIPLYLRALCDQDRGAHCALLNVAINISPNSTANDKRRRLLLQHLTRSVGLETELL